MRVLLLTVAWLCWAATAHAQFVHDTFTGTNGTNLNAHTGETGATWVEQGSLTTDMVIASNRIHLEDSGAGAYYASGVPASADYDVTAVIRRHTNLAFLGVAGRMVTGSLAKYVCVYHSGNAAWTLQEYDAAGSATTLDSEAATLTDGQDYTVTLRLRGASISCAVGGVEVAGATDSTLSAAGRAGVFGFDASGGSTGYHIDTFTARDVAVTPCVLGGGFLC